MATNLQTFLAVKALEQDGERWIAGWATTPREDLAGDIVVPEGAAYSLPLPLLFAHDHAQPVGAVTQAEVSRAGIRIKAKLTAGVSKAEEVWKLLSDGALTAVSVGFVSLKNTPRPGGGLRFDSWLWTELSVVAVPMNPDARVAVAKCAVHQAASTDDAVPAKYHAAPARDVAPFASGFDPEMFGTAVGESIRESIKGVEGRALARINALEARISKLENE